MNPCRFRRSGIALAATLAWSLGALPTHAYIRASYSLGRIMSESGYVAVFRVTEVDRGKNMVSLTKVRDIKGTFPDQTMQHNIGNFGEFNSEGKQGADPKGFRDSRDIMELASVGKDVVMFCNPGASQCEICMGTYWYQAWKEGAVWRMVHAEPTFAMAFAGRPASLIKAVDAMHTGKEVVVPCMAQSDVKLLLERTAKLQRIKASLKIQDYNPQRDFVGWGGDGGDGGELRPVAGMPGFTHYRGLADLGRGPVGVAPADFTGDGKLDLCLYGQQRVILMEDRDGGFNECSAGIEGGARSAAWADYNGDGRQELLLVTPSGLRLLAYQGDKFLDCTGCLPPSPYPHITAATWIGGAAGALPDILAADGFRGLRLYRNKTTKTAAPSATQVGKWYYAGPFDNTGGAGFSTAYPPEKGVDLAAKYTGKGGTSVTWKEGNFNDGQVNDLALFEAPHNENTAVYLYREIDIGGGADLPVSLGSDDTLTVWFNGRQVHAENVGRGCAPDQALLTLKTRPGRNTILLKVCQGGGAFAFYFAAKVPASAVPLAFEDVSDAVGLGLGGAAGKLKGDHLAVADVNGDGRPDVLYSAGSGVLLLNTPQGFKEAPACGIQYRAGGVTPAFGDFNGDGRPDLFVPQRKGASRLFVNEGKGRFRDVTERSGALAKAVGQATCAVWSDFCGRGKQDLLVGCVYGPNRYFQNTGNGAFTDAGEEIGLYQNIYNTYGLCAIDMNKDGVLDLILGNAGTESALLLGNKARLGPAEQASRWSLAQK